MTRIPFVSLSLLDIQALAADGAYSGLANLSNTSAALILSAALWMQRQDIWIGASFELTDAEIDEIDAMVALMQGEVMASMVGVIIPAVTATAPPNTLLCDGSAYLKADFPELFDALDPVFHIDPDNFNVPDLTDRYLQGVGSDAIGDTGGADAVALDITEMGRHSHKYAKPVAFISLVGAGVPFTPASEPAPVFNTFLSGGINAHENRPPFLAVNYYIVSGRP